MPPSLTGCPFFLPAGRGLSMFPLPTVRHLRLLQLIPDSLSPPRTLLHFRASPPTFFFPRLPVSILSAGPQGFSPFPSPHTRSVSPLPWFPHIPAHFPLQVPHFLPTWDCFLLPPKWDWGVRCVHCSLLTFLSSVDCILGIKYFFWLISTYEYVSESFCVWITLLRIFSNSIHLLANFRMSSCLTAE